MAFPKTEAELHEQGYHFKDKALCRGCQAKIEWWMTPAQKFIPLDPDTHEPHWGSCPAREQFKKKKK